MSFLGATGSGGVSGRIAPNTPTTPTISRFARSIADGAKFGMSSSGQGGSSKTSQYVNVKIYKTSDNTLFETVVNPSSNPFGTNLVLGTSYYIKTYMVDSVTGLTSAETSASSSVTALCLPGTPGTPTAVGSVNAFSTSWTASASGGETTTYTIKLYQSSNSGSSYTNIYTDTTTNASYSYSGLPGGSTYYYYVTVTPSNGLGSGTMVQSGTANVTAAPPPPPPPPPPYFPPFFGPFFGPYFCLQADSPVMTWVDGKTLQKKVKDLKVGDKVVSYTFAELPENDSEYSIDSWNSQSMTPLEVKEATVVTNEKLVTQSTLFFNNDQNNRMSLEHLVFVKRDGIYSIILAGLVEVGDTILKIDEESLTIYEDVVSSIEHVNEQTEIYKLDVTPYDIFFGGNMLTHNKGFFY